jgi:hypothetical protein
MFYPPSDSEDDSNKSSINTNRTCDLDVEPNYEAEQTFFTNLFSYISFNSLQHSLQSFLNNAERNFNSMSQPKRNKKKTIVLVISTHGFIPCEINGETNKYEPEMFIMPEGIEIHKISVATPGVANITHRRLIEYQIYNIQTSMQNLLSDNFNVASFIDNIKYGNDGWRQNIEYATKDLQQYEKDCYKKNRCEDFLYHSGKGYKYSILTAEDSDDPNVSNKVANKMYTRTIDEKNGNYVSITELNKTSRAIFEQPDLLFNIFGNRGIPLQNGKILQGVDLQFIVKHYKNLGFEKIILFDFSCSVFKYKDTLLDRPIARQLRRDMCKNNIKSGGKKIKKIKKIYSNKIKSNKIKSNKIKRKYVCKNTKRYRKLRIK